MDRFLGTALLEKDLVFYCVRKRYYAILGAMLGALFLAFVIHVVSFGDLASATETIRQFGFSFFAYQAALLFLLGPFFSANAFISEKERNCLGLLYLTSMGKVGIVVGKFLSRFILLELFAAACLPMAVACLFIGGISPREIFILFILVSLMNLLACALGTLLSLVLYRTLVAAMVTYIVLAFLFAGFDLKQGTAFWQGSQWNLWINPINAFNQMNIDRTFTEYWKPMIGVPVASLMLLLVSYIILPYYFGEGLSSVKRGLLWLQEKTARKYRRAEGVWDDPIYWKYSRGFLGQTGVVIFVFLISAIVYVGLLYLIGGRTSLLGDKKSFFDEIVLLSLSLYGVFLLTTLLASTVLAGEKENGTLPLLLVTPITGRQFIIGKVKGIIRTSGPVALLPIIHVIILAVRHDPQFKKPVIPFGYAVLFILLAVIAYFFFLGQGLYISLRQDSARRATMISLVVIVIENIFFFLFPGLNPILLTTGLQKFSIHMEQSGSNDWLGPGSILAIPFLCLEVLVLCLFYFESVKWFNTFIDRGD
ncbi:MAG: hypothetical protein E3J72_17055 [Planctomycetota bacterium]|nr:MAG: hypothetical protein E3J72_17055 [Planctomycetota bacterium]